MNIKTKKTKTTAGSTGKNFEIGDIFLVRSSGFVAKLIRLIIYIRYGVPVKEAFSHIESSYSSKVDISAEPSGVKLVANNRFDKKTYVKVYRLKRMTREKQNEHARLAESFIGKGYAYARYLLDTFRIATFYVVMMMVAFGFFGFVFSIGFSKIMAIVSAGIFIILTIAKPILAKRDILTHDCTELQSMIFSANGLWASLPKPRNEFPDGMKQVLDNLVLNGQAELIHEGYGG